MEEALSLDTLWREREKSRSWIRVNRTLVNETTMTVSDLVEKNDYEFRVIAENKVGPGEPSNPSIKFVAKAPFGKHAMQHIQYIN